MKNAIELDVSSWEALHNQTMPLFGGAKNNAGCTYVYRLGDVTFSYGEKYLRHDIKDVVDNWGMLSVLLYNLNHGKNAWDNIEA